MRVITEAIIRTEIKGTKPTVYYLPEDTLLSPAAREYLQQCKIAVEPARKKAPAAVENRPAAAEKPADPPAAKEPKYEDYETGAAYFRKPEHMTQLSGKLLVDKDHPRIKFRGKLDSVQAEVVAVQTQAAGSGRNDKLLADLQDVLETLRQILKGEVRNEALAETLILGLDHQELRRQSHDPMKYYNIKQLLLPDHTMGPLYAQLNLLRTQIRECEIAAVTAFKKGRKMERLDIIEALNRLSSALHIMMCRYLAGIYT